MPDQRSRVSLGGNRDPEGLVPAAPRKRREVDPTVKELSELFPLNTRSFFENFARFGPESFEEMKRKRQGDPTLIFPSFLPRNNIDPGEFITTSFGEEPVAESQDDVLARITSAAKASARAFLETGIGQTLMLGVKEIDPDIQSLAKKVMEAASGKPLKTSVTDQKRKQEMLAPIIKQIQWVQPNI